MSQAAGSYDQSYYQDENYVEAPKPPKMFDPSYLIPRLLFRWHWIVIGLILGLAYGFVSIKLATPLYRSKAIVRVADNNVQGETSAQNIDLKSQDAVQDVRETLDILELYQDIAQDPEVLSIRDLRPPPQKTMMNLVRGETPEAPTLREAPLDKVELGNMIKSWTEISLRANSRLIDIQVVHPNADVCSLVANKVVEHYSMRRKTAIANDKTSATERHGHRLRVVEAEIQETNRPLKSYNGPLKAEEKFIESEEEVAKLALEYTEKHPTMIIARKQYNIRKRDLTDQLTTVIESELDHTYWKDKKNSLRDIATSEQQLRKARLLVQSRVDELKAVITSKEDERDRVREEVGESERAEMKVEAEITPVEAARPPQHPFSPNLNNILMKGTVFGLAGGLALAFFFQLLDNKIGSVAEVEQAYGLPVLSAIRKLPDERTMQAEKDALADLPLSFAEVHPNLAVPGWASDPVYSEMFRVLRASVSLLGDQSERNVTLVSSSIPGEGKTFVAANLALAFAKQGTRTLLIDFDLRKPAVHKIFGQPRHGFAGIVNVLNGSAGLGDVIATFEGFTNLSVIFSGVKSPSPGELLEPAKLYSVIEAYAGNFDHVIIDSAPLLPVPDTRILAPLAHNFCLVVRADHTPRKATYSALELLAADGIQPSGVVLNDFTEKRLQAGKYGYGYGYGEYGESHEEEQEEIL